MPISHLMKYVDHTGNLTGQEKLFIWCPGCDELHAPQVSLAPGTEGPLWTWNGSLESPTTNPSLMVNRGTPRQCHSYVVEGKIRFERDSFHSLAGQTVPLPELPDWVTST